ncbi:hypothetical protein ADIARSV_2796 [Arcticibacter svalbardensis MN12-7]|uniref:Rad50/SbcC-type AAA domain-containing protein n=1 Tax=Arcticibacter svalbardensis MN12-7 TaxID=1150600 RepID=R9GQ44_9SPHI|nr:ATP-binding protein [Arcticibacter svalbardensis]EOR93962.1 hypothetical protein ADIARSV_2796 [Arcticibacter svalbardensis MN12-7]
MVINEVQINNFFCYLGKNTFSFTRGLNIISGRNGSGKSQFFNAFYWTFFDKIYSGEGSGNKKKTWDDDKNLTIYPDSISNSLDIDEQFQTSVEVTIEANDYQAADFTTDDTVIYNFKRVVTFKKTDRGIITLLPSELKIEYVQSGETFIVQRFDFEIVLNKIFPKSIRKFMWYQGETMDDLYDFSSKATLRNAIHEISYFPKYDFMYKVVMSSDASINKKIAKELAQQNRLSKEQNAIYFDITILENKISINEQEKIDLVNQTQSLEEELTKIEQKLEGIDHFMQYKIDLTRLEADQKITKSQIDAIEINTKERLINVWMLNGCAELIKAAESNLNILNTEIQIKQAHSNPIPMNLPGPEYVEQMLVDKICYICERSIVDDQAAYEALQRRLNDFQKNAHVKSLQDNYADLNRFRKRLLNDLPNINTEIVENENKKNALIRKRNSLGKQISNVFNDLGFEERADLETNASIAQQNINKHKTYRTDKSIKLKRISVLEQELLSSKLELSNKKALRDNFTKSQDINLAESVASDYISLFIKSISVLKDSAYNTLIKELEIESNRLYSLYLDGKEQGVIKIDDSAHVVDMKTGMQLNDLNQGELVAQKLALANAFLSLSAKKMNRSYPLIADAPSSDLDAGNTYNLTVNIGASFEQIIIMSKDYTQFDNEQLAKLIIEADIKNFYQITSEFINPTAGKSRTNRRSITTKIK